MLATSCPDSVIWLPQARRAIFVVKADGRRVPFEIQKVESTCLRAGASPLLAKRIGEYIENVAFNGIKTRAIYKMVLAALAGETEKPEIKHRYRLKEALMLLGPAGFNFESYIGQVFSKFGYRMDSIRSTVSGRCIAHEIDIVMTLLNNNTKIMVECKYHNFAGAYTGLKESLYTHARFLDIREGGAENFDGEMIVTNTHVSKDALRYAGCIGQKVFAWNYPAERGLERMIEGSGLYPITILKLSPFELQSFARAGIMVARDLLEGASIEQISSKTSIKTQRLAELQDLAKRIIFR